jgi:hypothetical protein
LFLAWSASLVAIHNLISLPFLPYLPSPSSLLDPPSSIYSSYSSLHNNSMALTNNA